MKNLRIQFMLMALTITFMGCGQKNFQFEKTAACSDNCVNSTPSPSPSPSPGPTSTHYDYVEYSPDARQVDLLFVIDNSGSMAEEQANLGQRFAGFISTLNNVNWQIAVTNTDVTSPSIAGALMPFRTSVNGPITNLKVINNSTPDAENLFRSTVQMGTNGSGDERGIYAANVAIDRNVNGTDTWIRSTSHFGIVIVSDEDERSVGGNVNGGSQYKPLETYDLPDTLVNAIPAKLGSSRTFSVHSIIMRPGDNNCTTGSQFGTLYDQVSRMTNGVIGDICSQDYTSQLVAIGQNLQQQIDSVALKCTTPINGVNVQLMPSQSITTHVSNGRLYFSPSPAPGTKISLIYDCP